MKAVEEKAGEVLVGGASETVSFSFANTPELMKNVISSIYSQGPKTVSRELMANAYDAHAAAGTPDRAVEVSLPTTFDPNFVVRDFGIGMSHEFVMRLYSVIGHSTKKDSNSETGMFGVGSKSPLAITDTFTIRCYDKPGWKGSVERAIVGGKEVDLNETGRVRLYTVAVVNDVPQISHTFNVEPREDDRVELGGTQVKVPCTPQHRQKLIDGIAEQHFGWFDRPIKFTGNSFKEIESKCYASVSKLADGMYLAKSAQSRYNSHYFGVFVRQGAAVYPLDENEMRQHLGNETISLMKTFTTDSRNLMIDVPLGTANVTMARESIRYTPQTVQNLKKVINNIIDGFRQKLVKVIDKCDNYNDALVRMVKEYAQAKENDLSAMATCVPLLTLVSKTIEANYQAKYDKLPDIMVDVPKRDGNGLFERDSNGNTIYEKKLGRPPHRRPSISTRLKQSDFPEGKVLLHTGTAYSYGNDKIIDMNSGVVNEINFQIPCLVYVIHSHLHKWSDRVGKHGSTLDVILPNDRYSGIAVYVIRCAKKNVAETVQLIKDRNLDTRLFLVDDLPEVDVSPDVRARTYSKTSVYQWDNTRGDWGLNKVEPDYTQKAYFVTRVGGTHEVFSNAPDKPLGHSPGTAGYTLVPRLSQYDMERLIRDSRKMNLIDSTTPIYRVTENQADKINTTAPDWEHLISKLALSVEKAVRKDDTGALYSSYIATSSGDHYLMSMVKDAMTATAASSKQVKRSLEIVQLLAKNCENFRTVVGARFAFQHNKTGKFTFPLPQRSEPALATLSGILFGSASSSTSGRAAEVQRYNDLVTNTERRYAFLTRILGTNYQGDETLKHIGYYLDGFLAEVKTHPKVNYTDLAHLKDVADFFQKTLDGNYVAVYGKPAP